MNITREQAWRFLAVYHGLTEDTAFSAIDGIVEYARRVGCVQFDPLDVVGRNPDLVLQSRIARYRKGDIDRELYGERRLFDVWDKNMSICPIEDWPYFSRFRARYLPWCEQHSATIESITQYLLEHDCACSSDFDYEERVRWHYGPQRLAKAALECMCYAGLAVVHHKKGTRRYYGLAERYIPKELYDRPDPNEADDEYYEWATMRRLKSVGMLWDKSSNAWLGIGGFRSLERNKAFAALLAKGMVAKLDVESIKEPLYIASEHVPLLKEAESAPCTKESVRILAPLDNLLWDRNLIRKLYDFDYKWEVYTPSSQRRYGYYVLPVMYGDRLIARFEPEHHRKSDLLKIKNWWWETGAITREMRDGAHACLQRFAKYLGANGYSGGDVI